MLFRDLNMETSLRVFCGEYIAQSNVKEISDKYWQITKALELVNFPFGAFARPFLSMLSLIPFAYSFPRYQGLARMPRPRHRRQASFGGCRCL